MAKQKQKKRADIPSNDHVGRYCNPQRIIRDPSSQQVLGVFPEAFALRAERNENYLSAHWMEKLAYGLTDQFGGVVDALNRKGIATKPRGGILRINAGTVVAVGLSLGHTLRVSPRPTETDPCYSGIFGLPPDNRDHNLLSQLAQKSCVAISSGGTITSLNPV